jgi:hypothetical protein
MRVTEIRSLTAKYVGPEGPYVIRFAPSQEGWDGTIDVEIAGKAMRWSVEAIDRGEGGLTVSGMTATADVWGDSFWFEAVIEPCPGHITYWGNQLIWRTDLGADD